MLMSAEDFAFELCPALGDAATEMKQLDIAIITVEDIKAVLRNRLIVVNNQRRETRVLSDGATASLSTSKVQPFVSRRCESFVQVQLEATVHCYVKTEVMEIHEVWMVVWEDDGSVADVLQCVKNSVRRIDADDLNEIYLATLEGAIQHLDKSCRLSSILSGGEELWAVQDLVQ